MTHTRSQHFCLIVFNDSNHKEIKLKKYRVKLVKPKPYLRKAPKIHVHIIFKFTSLTNLTAPVGS